MIIEIEHIGKRSAMARDHRRAKQAWRETGASSRGGAAASGAAASASRRRDGAARIAQRASRQRNRGGAIKALNVRAAAAAHRDNACGRRLGGGQETQ